jgi:hypothetical protein
LLKTKNIDVTKLTAAQMIRALFSQDMHFNLANCNTIIFQEMLNVGLSETQAKTLFPLVLDQLTDYRDEDGLPIYLKQIIKQWQKMASYHLQLRDKPKGYALEHYFYIARLEKYQHVRVKSQEVLEHMNRVVVCHLGRKILLTSGKQQIPMSEPMPKSTWNMNWLPQ